MTEEIVRLGPRPTVWTWYVFGKDTREPPFHLMVVALDHDVPLRQRILTRILLGSVWERQ